MKFNPGDLAYLRTTSEKLIILGARIKDTDTDPVTYNVRRPVATQSNGLQHTHEVFFEFELEHFDEQLTREFSDMEKVEALRSKLQSNAKAAGAVQTSPLVN